MLLSGSASRARHLSSGAFVWQLAWRPAVSVAVAQNAGQFTTWHVLAAELSPDGSTLLARPDWPTLTAQGHPVIPVLRIEGRIGRTHTMALLERLRAVLASLPAAADGVEIDHDAATARLPDYTHFLGALRAGLKPGTRIGITALPSWTGSPDFPALAASADRLILQVHAIEDPRLGLFNAGRALAATRALAARVRTPFEVALPAYGARVSVTGAGLSVSAETPANDARPGQEVAADPAEVARFIAALSRDPPDGLTGIVWFRLPVPGDTRAWSAATLSDVAAGRAPLGRAVVSLRDSAVAGASDILVGNSSPDDVVLPRRIVLPQNCVAADGVGQYVLEPGRLSLRGAGLLAGHASVPAGWMRCSGDVHAEN